MKKYSKEHIENRIHKLESKPMINAKIINKWKRILRKAETNVEA